MIPSLEAIDATLLILGWALILSIAWAWFLAFSFRRGRSSVLRRVLQRTVRWSPFVPALVLAPLAILVFYRIGSVDLIFPSRFSADFVDLVVASFIPGVVLFLTGGLFLSLSQATALEFGYWRQKGFCRTAAAFGFDPLERLQWLVFVRALGQSWSRCLPWVIGETIVIESVFNAPGLGLRAWHLARMRELGDLAATLGIIVLIYLALFALTANLNAWVGAKLEGY